MDRSLAILGAGRMGEALLGGLLRSGWITPDQMRCTVRGAERATTLAAAYGVHADTDSPAAAAAADVLLVAVKPQNLRALLDEIAGEVSPRHTVISVVAGVPTTVIEDALAPGVAVVRVMSNVPVQVDEAMSAVAPGRHAGPEHLAVADAVLGSVGKVVHLAEEHLDAVTALSGSGPAYFFLLAEAMIDAGILLGLSRDVSSELVIQTMVGSAKMLRDTAVEASYESTRAALVASGEVAAAQQDAIAQSLSQALNQAVESATAGQRVQAQAAAEALDAQADELVVSAPFAGTVQLGEAAAADGGAVPPGVPPELAGAVGSLGGLAGGDGGGGTLRVGAPVTAGQTLFSVYDLSQLYVTADVDEVDAPQVKPGQSATVLVDAFPDATFDGIVEEINVAAEVTEAGGVGYPVRIRILGPADGSPKVKRRALRVGMTASAEIDTKTATSDLVVPSRALLRRDGGDVVYVVRDGRVAVVDVKVIALGEDRAAVRGDLRPDERVVVAGYEDLVDGDRVTAT